MRTPSMVLGIIGGALSLIWALILVFAAVAFFSFTSSFDSPLTDSYDSFDLNDFTYSDSFDSGDYQFNFDSGDYQFNYDTAANIGGTVIIVGAVLAFIAGVLGLAGGIMVNKHNTASGVMMIIAAPLSLIGYFNIISMTLFIIGAVYALKKERQPYPPYPPYQSGQYPPYPPYPYPQAPGSIPAPPAQPQAPADTPAPPEQPKE